MSDPLADIFAPLERAGIVERVCPRCGERLPVNCVVVEVIWPTRSGQRRVNCVLCGRCGDELRAWLGAVAR
jgi:hypothetical protein